MRKALVQIYSKRGNVREAYKVSRLYVISQILSSPIQGAELVEKNLTSSNESNKDSNRHPEAPNLRDIDFVPPTLILPKKATRHYVTNFRSRLVSIRSNLGSSRDTRSTAVASRIWVVFRSWKLLSRLHCS